MKPVEILMIDDDEADYELFIRQLKRDRIANPTHRANDGVDGLAFLKQWQLREDPAPLLVLLDINMPRMGGLECLKAIREDEALRSTIVFMLTTSSHDEDIINSYDLNVAGYLVKGELGPSFVKGVNLLENYWKIVELPTPPQ